MRDVRAVCGPCDRGAWKVVHGGRVVVCLTFSGAEDPAVGADGVGWEVGFVDEKGRPSRSASRRSRRAGALL